jgi:redox-sensing transcriptional repressor
MSDIPDKTLERLCLYRRLLEEQLLQSKERIYSHELAELAHITPAQVRRDLMFVAHVGSTKGYKIRQLIDDISSLLGSHRKQNMILFGIGNLGRAILSYFIGKRADLPVIAAFDINPEVTGRVIAGCRCYNFQDLDSFLKSNSVDMAILAVPGSAVQTLVDLLIDKGIRTFINFAPPPVIVPHYVYVEYVDITLSFEKAAYFARKQR